jgi:flagellar biosynthesis/type III secretory pathway protein FliH
MDETKKALAEAIEQVRALGFLDGLARGMLSGHEDGLVEGRADGLAQGRAEGRLEVFGQFVAQRFAMLSPEQCDKLATATDEELARYCRRLLEQHPLTEIFAD